MRCRFCTCAMADQLPALARCHLAPGRPQLPGLIGGPGTVGLLGEPEGEVGSPVADVAADLEAAGPGAEVAPVAQGAFGDAEEGAGFLEAEHLVAEARRRAGVLVGVALGCGHGGVPRWSMRP